MADDSLVLGSGRQLALLELDDVGLPAAAYELGEQAGRFTGERLFSQNPKLYRAIVALLGRAVPYREISDICSVSVNTVCAVSQREGVPIETIRERIGRLGMDVAALTLEAIRDVLADPELRIKLSAKDLAIVHGIAFTNAQLALGGATSRPDMGDRTAKPSHDDYLEFIKNVTGTGLAAGTAAQKADVPALPADCDQVVDIPVQPAPGAQDPAAAAEAKEGTS